MTTHPDLARFPLETQHIILTLLLAGWRWETPTWAAQPILTQGDVPSTAWCPQCHRAVAMAHYHEPAGWCHRCIRAAQQQAKAQPQRQRRTTL